MHLPSAPLSVSAHLSRIRNRSRSPGADKNSLHVGLIREVNRYTKNTKKGIGRQEGKSNIRPRDCREPITKESKIEKTCLLGRQIRAPGGSPAGLARTRRESSLDGGRRNLSASSIPTSESGGEALSPGPSSPPGPLSFLGLPPGGLNFHLFRNSKGDPCLFYFGLIYNLISISGSYIFFLPFFAVFSKESPFPA